MGIPVLLPVFLNKVCMKLSLSSWGLGLALASLGVATSPCPVAAEPVATSVATHSDRLARIQAAGQVRVCIWPDYYSISLRDPRTQMLSGIDIDLAQALGKDWGVGV